MTADRVPAVGSTRTVPAPDAVARDYLLLALRLDQHVPGTVDGYFGPAELKARVDMEQLRAPARLADDAAGLRDRLPAEVAEPDRRHWLDLQLVALETLARSRAGHVLPYVEHVSRCFAWTPERRPDERFAAAAAELDALLPGPGTLAERLEAEDAAWTVPQERVAPIVHVLVTRFRARAAALFDVPEGEDLRVTLVHDQPWSGYNWYDGGLRSRVDLNLDLPIRLPALLGVVAHETFPGHHLEHASKERALLEDRGRLEASALLINTPECLISEGLANLGREFAVPPGDRAELLVGLAPSAGVAIAGDPGALAEAAARESRLTALRAILDETRVNAALLLHADGLPRDAVLDYLREVGRLPAAAAAKRLEFIDHPLWRTYVFVYSEGEALLRRWLDAVDAAPFATDADAVRRRAARFGRLLREPLTPPAILAEIGVAGTGASARGGPAVGLCDGRAG